MSTEFSEKIIEDGNFWFMKIINPDIYENLYEGEKNAMTDFRKSGSMTRDAMEAIISTIIREHGLEKKISGTLFEKISFLQNEGDLRKVGYLSSGERLKDKPILPDLGRIKFRYENGTSDETDYYTYMRKFGNSCSHNNIEKGDIKIDYTHVINCLKCYHLFMRKYYSKRISKNTPPFNETLMPIDNYRIQDSYVPTDSNRSKCNKEFVGYLQGSTGRSSYAILRLYNKSDLNEKFILRNAETFQEASSYSISTPEGMAQMREVANYNDSKSSFYIIAYEFNREPQKLTTKILKGMDIGKRVKMCKRIADCFYDLHKSEIPIYHRMLSYESIYVCDYKKEWVPYIIKFDFAKIQSTEKGTVVLDALKAKERIDEAKQIKYFAPEWMSTEDPKNLDWEKMDIYSLGVLFCDILSAKINMSLIDIDELEKFELSDDLLDLLDKMTSETPSFRCDMEEVQIVLEEEARNWR